MSKPYYISVTCTGYHIFKVNGAESEAEAIEAAENAYQCDMVGGEYCETMSGGYDEVAEEIEA